MFKKIPIYFLLIFYSNGYSFAQDLANDPEAEKEYLNQISGGIIYNPLFIKTGYLPPFHLGYKRNIKKIYLRGAFNFSDVSNLLSYMKINLGVQHNFNIKKNLKLTYATDIVYGRTNSTEYMGLAPNVGAEYFVTKRFSFSTEYGLAWAKTIKGSYNDLFVFNRLFGLVLNYNF